MVPAHDLSPVFPRACSARRALGPSQPGSGSVTESSPTLLTPTLLGRPSECRHPTVLHCLAKLAVEWSKGSLSEIAKNSLATFLLTLNFNCDLPWGGSLCMRPGFLCSSGDAGRPGPQLPGPAAVLDWSRRGLWAPSRGHLACELTRVHVGGVGVPSKCYVFPTAVLQMQTDWFCYKYGTRASGRHWAPENVAGG